MIRANFFSGVPLFFQRGLAVAEQHWQNIVGPDRFVRVENKGGPDSQNQRWGRATTPSADSRFADQPPLVAPRRPALNPNPAPLDPKKILAYLLDNVSPPDAHPGAVVAATSRENPPYYFHWVRDAALVMSHLAKKHARETDPALKAFYFERLKDFAWFSNDNQNRASFGGIGEPKYHVNGDPFEGPWGRPQNDGPALRALTLTRFAATLLHDGYYEPVRSLLYDSRQPGTSVIKRDLEYVAHHWRETCFDLWEEVNGLHFYTLLCQRRALLEGAKLADTLGDSGAAEFYEKTAREMEPVILKFWNPKKGHIECTQDRVEGLAGKTSGLDTAAILAALHADGDDSFFTVADDHILATGAKLIMTFDSRYPINSKAFPATVLGRYPEDVYYGGNPWVLTTSAMAELCFRVAKKFEKQGAIQITKTNLPFFKLALTHLKTVKRPKWRPGQIILATKEYSKKPEPDFQNIVLALTQMGQDFLDRIAIHAPENQRLSEQIDRHSGFMLSADNLTWSYASVLTALAARDELKSWKN